MGMQNVWIVYRKELTEALRDRRTLITTFLVPLLMIPLLGSGFVTVMSAVIGNAKKEKPKVMIVGGADSPALLAALHEYPKIDIVSTTPDWRVKIIEKNIRAAIEVPPNFDENLDRGQAGTVNINIYGGEIKSELAAGNIEGYLKEYRQEIAAKRLEANHLPGALLKPFDVKRQSIATPEKEAAALFGAQILMHPRYGRGQHARKRFASFHRVPSRSPLGKGTAPAGQGNPGVSPRRASADG